MDGFEIIRTYRDLQKDHLYPFEDSWVEQHPHLKEEIETKRKSLDELRGRLDDITVKQLKQCQRNLILSIEETLRQTAPSKFGYPLSRNQGTVIPNYLFGKVLGTIDSAMNSATGHWSPTLYLDRGGDFDPEKIRTLLTDFLEEIQNGKYSDFLELEEAFNNFSRRFRGLWSEENKLHPQKVW